MFKASGGSCSREIGPLEAHQGFIPIEMHWPEGLPTMMERLEQFDKFLHLSAPDGVGHESEVDKGNTGNLEIKVDAVEAKIDVLFNDVQIKVDALSNEVQTKVAAVEAKVDSLIELNKKLINLLDQKSGE